MNKKEEYTNTKIAADVLSYIYKSHDHIPLALYIQSGDPSDPDFREAVKNGAKELIDIFNGALEELKED